MRLQASSVMKNFLFKLAYLSDMFGKLNELNLSFKEKTSIYSPGR